MVLPALFADQHFRAAFDAQAFFAGGWAQRRRAGQGREFLLNSGPNVLFLL
jgi:hypothetical protein